MFVKLLMIFWHIRQKPYRCGRFSGSFPQPHICERLFAMANSFKQNCMRQFATAKSPSGIARGNSPRRTAPNRIARDNSPWRTAPNRIARDNSPWRTVITKNGTAIRHGEQPLQKNKEAALHSPLFGALSFLHRHRDVGSVARHYAGAGLAHIQINLAHGEVRGIV